MGKAPLILLLVTIAFVPLASAAPTCAGDVCVDAQGTTVTLTSTNSALNGFVTVDPDPTAVLACTHLLTGSSNILGVCQGPVDMVALGNGLVDEARDISQEPVAGCRISGRTIMCTG